LRPWQSNWPKPAAGFSPCRMKRIVWVSADADTGNAEADAANAIMSIWSIELAIFLS
jgi:hypothetical protein